MNRILVLIITLGIVALGAYALSALGSKKEVKMENKKILIVYYSYSGNTKEVAEKIEKTVGGDIFEIKPKKEYPRDYNTVVNQAKVEKQTNAKVELVGTVDVSPYDIVFVGTPVWWYTMATPVSTFLAENDLEGKIIVPFCTHGGGGASSTYSDIQKLAPGAKVLEGFTSYENSAKSSDVEKWIEKLNRDIQK